MLPSPRIREFFLMGLAVLIGCAIMVPAQASASESRTIADTWSVDVGFIHEPAIQNDTNGLRVKITKGDQPVEGLEAALKAQAVFAGQARELPLSPVAGQSGVYTSVFIPTQPGEYSFVLNGTIGEQPVEETFHSSPDGVPLVASRLDYEFPTAAHGSVSRVAYPAIAGATLLIGGTIGYIVRKHRSGAFGSPEADW